MPYCPVVAFNKIMYRLGADFRIKLTLKISVGKTVNLIHSACVMTESYGSYYFYILKNLGDQINTPHNIIFT